MVALGRLFKYQKGYQDTSSSGCRIPGDQDIRKDNPDASRFT
jgi:hypothetical protein